MEKENMQETIEKDTIETVEILLFNRWIEEELIPKMAKEPTNIDRLRDILFSSKEQRSTIPIITVGCQPIADVSGSNGQIIGIPSKLDTRDSSRPLRWAKGIASLQSSLKSFGISTHIFLSLSDMELLAQTLDFPEDRSLIDSDQMNQNIEILTDLINTHGGNVSSFSHSLTLANSIGVKDLNTLVSKILPNWKGELLTHTVEGDGTEELPNALYDVDPVLLPNALIVEEEKESLIWLDMMSDLATQDHLQLKNSISKNLPDTPLISPVRNGGNWSACGEPPTVFRNRFEFINSCLRVNNFNGSDREEWLSRIQNSVKDETLEVFLNGLGIEGEIVDMSSRINAVKLVEFITFGSTKFNLNKVKEIEFNGIRLKDVISQATRVSTQQVFAQLKQGSVFVNGEIASDINFVPQTGDIIKIGKKTTIKIV